ncbi:MAG: MFS transporter [Gammaproteobacteria bacterium]|nr:MFS transporter [Gammaproteobacteria bacterium]
MKQRKSSALLAGIIGNAIETYDLSIYPFFTVYLAKAFFPDQSSFVSLLEIFGIFLFGYLARPLGSLIFGYIGDIYGRKKALISSSLLMMVATGIIGILPTYQSIGYFAALLLLIFRAIQGLSFGGEYTGSVIYLVEHASKHRRNTFGSIAAMGSNLGIFLSSITCLLITLNFSEQQIMQGLWRIPFLLSLLFSLICFGLRSFIYEPKDFDELLSKKSIDRRSILELIKHQKTELALIIVLTWFGVITTYLLFVYLVPYLVHTLHYQTSTALTLNALSIGVLVSIIPLAGFIADKVGRNIIIPTCIVSLAILIIPYLYFISTTHYRIIIFLQLAITVPAAFYFATVPVFLVELIQVSVRCRTVSLGYNIAAAIFGGTTPLIALSLVEKTNLPFMPGIYLIICAIITFIMLRKSKSHLTIST